MEGDECVEMRLLIQADMDGELASAEAARVRAHLDGCDRCAEMQAQLVALSDRLRRDMPYHAASKALREAVHARLAAVARAEARCAPVARPSWTDRLPRWHLGSFVPFGGGFALAAGLLLLLALPRGGGLPETVIEGHIRALQPGHLMDVVSTDQHTVKPWFDGRLDFAPPVRDLKAEGFPLAGGRLDYLAGRAVAALVYRRRQHAIDLFVWPRSGLDRNPAEGSRNGYNFLRWNRDGMAFWAVSDLAAPELAEFVRLWQAG